MVPLDLHMKLKVHCVTSDKTMNDCFLSALVTYLQNECNSVELDTNSASNSPNDD